MRRLAGALTAALLLLGVTSASAADITAKAAAAADAAQRSPRCQRLGDFYWEIGDAKGKLASGQVGDKFGPNTSIGIDSASKLVFGAYALEKLGHAPASDQARLLNMTGGYAHVRGKLLGCSPYFGGTVKSCARYLGTDKADIADIGVFSYGGAGDQELALQLGLGDSGRTELEAEYRKYLGDDLNFTFRTLSFAGGLKSTPDNYAVFLRRILSGKLLIHDYLGADAVCTDKDACPGKALFSPAPLPWHYSLNHWVEDDPTGDGAFSSPGLEGFYPWISADKTTYGLVARQKMGRQSYIESAMCGIAIRKAWMIGKDQ